MTARKQLPIKEALRQSLALEGSTRRAVIRGGAALAVAAAGVVAVTGAAKADDGDEAMRDLWWRAIEAEIVYARAIRIHSELGDEQHRKCGELPRPWLPFGADHWEIGKPEMAPTRRVIEMTVAETVKQEGESGPWLVKEYQPARYDYPHYRADDCPTRWQPYPEAETAEAALAAAKARAEKDWRSHRGKRAAITRKLGLKAADAAAEAMHEACIDIRLLIAKTPSDTPYGAAVKLAMALVCMIALNHGEEPDATDLKGAEHASLLSAYRVVAKLSGYDPVEAWKAARPWEDQ